MKMKECFEEFIPKEVNLNKTRIDKLQGHVRSIEAFLDNADWAAQIHRYSAQGSWAHKTITKPQGNRGFDADLLVFVSPVGGWTAKDYVAGLKNIFTASGTYKDKISLHTRCISVDYAGDCNIDVVPCVVNRPGGTSQYEVCNRIEDVFEMTDSEAFTAWLGQRN